VSRYNIAQPPSNYAGRIRAYAVYQAGTLASIVLINTRVAYKSESNKASLTIDLTLPSQFAGESLYLSYLSAGGVDSMSGTTWNGLSFEQSGDGTPTRVSDGSTSLTIGSNGNAIVTVRDSQALVANIGSRVGTRKYNASACASLMTKRVDADAVVSLNTLYDVRTNSAASNSAAATPLPTNSINSIAVTPLPIFFSALSAFVSGVLIIYW